MQRAPSLSLRKPVYTRYNKLGAYLTRRSFVMMMRHYAMGFLMSTCVFESGCNELSSASPEDTDGSDGKADSEREGDGGAESDVDSDETDVSTDTNPITELCGIQDTVDVLDGEYRVSNNVWGKEAGVGEQCIRVQGTSFEVTRSTHNSQSVASYPFIHKGCHLGGECTKDSGMPIQISDINECRFHWKTDTSTADGAWDVAYESWFSQNGNGMPSGELMVWINRKGSASIPAGTPEEEDVEIGGRRWYVSRGIVYMWNYIAYIAKEPFMDADIDFTLFIDDAISRGDLQPEWYLDAMEAGFEIWKNAETIRTVSFEAYVE